MRSIPVYLTTVLLLTGCAPAGSPAWHSLKMDETSTQSDDNNRKIMKLNLGQTKPEVLDIMSPAAKREAYQLSNGKNIEFLFYRTSGWEASDSGDRDSHFTPFAFDGGKLVGWGRNYYDNVVREAVDVTVR